MASKLVRALVISVILVTVTGGRQSDPELTEVTSQPLYQPECRTPLGMQSGEIPDESITASSSYDEKSVGPLNSRIRTEIHGGAWCPRPQITKEIYEYLQIDLGAVKVITLVETQGRFGNGQGMEYAPHYLIDYQRQDGGPWVRYHSHQRKQVIKGNTNTYIAESRELRPPIIARRVRFVPYSVHPRTICMRVELHGCDGQGIVSYAMPQGETRGSVIDFYDHTYDGREKDGYLSGGLGQLTDYTYGESSFRLDPLRTGYKGYGWVGWRNDSRDLSPVEVQFLFDQVREFTSVRIHCNNQFGKSIAVFRKAEVHFSVGGEYFTSEPVQYEYYRDVLMPQARNVTIPIPHNIGRFVKLVLHFDARWLMISEVSFESVPFDGNVTEEINVGSTEAIAPTTVKTNQQSPHDQTPRTKGPDLNFPSNDPNHRNAPERNRVRTSSDPAADWTLTDVRNNLHSQANDMEDTYIGIIIGTLTAMLLLVGCVAAFFLWQQRRKKLPKGSIKVFGREDLSYGLASAKLANGVMYNAVATNMIGDEKDAEKHVLPTDVVFDSQKKVTSHDFPDTSKSTELRENETNTNRYERGDKVVKTSSRQQSHESEFLEGPSSQRKPGAVSRGAAPSQVKRCILDEGVSSVSNPDILPRGELSMMEFPRERLQFVDKLGEGQFGEVHLFDVGKSILVLDNEYQNNKCVPVTKLVAVKMLRPDASDQAKLDFQQEAEILSRLKDPNLVHVVGICTQGEPLAVVLEYTTYGDLHQFLLGHIPETNLNTHDSSLNQLSHGCLVYIATQIASGMKYLETLNMVHRDLAARNCLVGDLYEIKISDFGMSRSVFSRDYYRIDNKAMLPIRWMAWESVLLGKFSCKSDVWSFAVTLWEIMTFSRHRPHWELSDKEVLDNCGRYYQDDDQEVALSKPASCPKEIYDLMTECWSREDALRPTFREIHMFLSRKNIGYDPRDEKPMAKNVCLY